MAYISKCKHGKYIAMCDDCYPKTKLQQGWEEGYAKMDKQHKWHKEIKAWADGVEIECYCVQHDKWVLTDEPQWYESANYRIKPQPKEPQYLYVYKDFRGDYQITDNDTDERNIRKIKLED